MPCRSFQRLNLVVALVAIVFLAPDARAADAHPKIEPSAPRAVAGARFPRLRAGVVFSALSPQALRDIVILRPWATRLTDNFHLDGHLIYTAHRFDRIPLDIEIEAGVAKRFGTGFGGSAWEFDLAPIMRWRWFPWNDYVYTNLRLGLLGASYVTEISRYERAFDANGHGSRILNWILYEFTFAPREDSPFEVFVRAHHRSGAGVINHTRGASNYVGAGVRFTVY